MREKDAADYELERIINLFDEALTSKDPRVKNALRQLLMIVVLTSNEHEDRQYPVDKVEGPLRQLHNDIYNLNRRVSDLERRSLQDYPKETTIRKGYNIGGMGSTPHSQWPEQSIPQTMMEKLATHGNDPWTLNKIPAKGLK